jgi:hypothetical protein
MPKMIHLFIRRAFAVLSVAVFLITACHKKTSSDFRLSRYNYSPGETLELINLSPKKRHQIWEILNPNGDSDTVVEGQAPQLTLNVLGKDGIYKVRVFDNKNEKSKNVASEKTFLVSAERGDVYIHNYVSYNFPLSIDNQSFLVKNGDHLRLPVGVHAFKASQVFYDGGPTHTIDTVVNITVQNSTHILME